jgi:peptide subunit release factor 1 (eRF1)
VILDAHGISYEIQADEQAIEKANDIIKRTDYYAQKRQGMVENSFYSISIPDGALKGLTPSVLRALEKHNIFPEMEMLPEEKVPEESFVIDEKYGRQKSFGMGLSSLVVLIAALILWYFYVRP